MRRGRRADGYAPLRMGLAAFEEDRAHPVKEEGGASSRIPTTIIKTPPMKMTYVPSPATPSDIVWNSCGGEATRSVSVWLALSGGWPAGRAALRALTKPVGWLRVRCACLVEDARRRAAKSDVAALQQGDDEERVVQHDRHSHL